MDLDWIIQEPIDFEYKQYLILDYVKKAEEKLDNLEIYPTFQELAIHFASMERIKKHFQFITLKELPEEGDDEILVTDLIYSGIMVGSEEERISILNTAEYANDKFKDLFMMAKSLWSIVYESVMVDLVKNKDTIVDKKSGRGFFYFEYKDELYVYQYKITTIKEKTLENKCFVEKIYQGEVSNIDNILIGCYKILEDVEDKGVNYEIFSARDRIRLNEDERIKHIENLPLFKITFTDEFPLEGSLLSLVKRKIMNYIFQTVKLKELKE